MYSRRNCVRSFMRFITFLKWNKILDLYFFFFFNLNSIGNSLHSFCPPNELIIIIFLSEIKMNCLFLIKGKKKNKRKRDKKRRNHLHNFELWISLGALIKSSLLIAEHSLCCLYTAEWDSWQLLKGKIGGRWWGTIFASSPTALDVFL